MDKVCDLILQKRERFGASRARSNSRNIGKSLSGATRQSTGFYLQKSVARQNAMRLIAFLENIPLKLI